MSKNLVLFITGVVVVFLFSLDIAQAEEQKVKPGPANTNQVTVSKQEQQLPVAPKMKGEKKLLLKNDGDVLVHVGFEKGFIGKGVTMKPITLKESFTIEIIVKPSGEQVAHAGIVGNHPGNGHDGFVIQQDAMDQNVYYFGYGNGEKWVPPLKFSRLNAGTWAYLTAVVDKTNMKVYVDGKFVASQDAQAVIKNSPLPLVIGNVVNEGGGRYFNGSIEEVRVSNAALPAAEISTNWDKLKKVLPKL
jgi:Concanavalin A-like lectin/glucanases superfamily